jgi:hypothetical protein
MGGWCSHQCVRFHPHQWRHGAFILLSYSLTHLLVQLLQRMARSLTGLLSSAVRAAQNVMKLGHDKRTAIQADAVETGAAVPPIRFAVLHTCWGATCHSHVQPAHTGLFASSKALCLQEGPSLADWSGALHRWQPDEFWLFWCVQCWTMQVIYPLANPVSRPPTPRPPCAAAFAAQSLLAALGSVQFIANVVFGRLVLKEPVGSDVDLLRSGCVRKDITAIRAVFHRLPVCRSHGASWWPRR